MRENISAALNNKAAELKSGFSEYFLLRTFSFHVCIIQYYILHTSKIPFVLTLYFYHEQTSVGQQFCQKQQSHLPFASLLLLLLSLVHMKRKKKNQQMYASNLVLNHTNSLALQLTAKPQKHLY